MTPRSTRSITCSAATAAAMSLRVSTSPSSPSNRWLSHAGMDAPVLAAKFAACMRQNGVDVPDPIAAGDEKQGAPRAGVTRVDKESPKTRAAMKKCEDKLPKGGPGGGVVRFSAPGEVKGR